MNWSKYSTTIWGLVRYQTWFLLVLYMFCGFAITAQISGQTFNELVVARSWLIASTVFLLGLWYASGTGMNDYADYEIDLVNLRGHKDRPLVEGIVSKAELRVIIYALVASAIVVSIGISSAAFALTIGFICLNWAYSFRPFILSRRGGVAPLLLPLGYIVYPLTLAIIVAESRINWLMLLLICALYLQFCSRIILKDYRDVVGDAKANKITFLLKHGSEKVVYASLSALTLSTVLLSALLLRHAYVGYICIVLLSTIAGSTLYQIIGKQSWSDQKPIIVAFGRLVSGTTCLLFLSLLRLSASLSQTEFTVLCVLFSILFLWSSLDILRSKVPKRLA